MTVILDVLYENVALYSKPGSYLRKGILKTDLVARMMELVADLFTISEGGQRLLFSQLCIVKHSSFLISPETLPLGREFTVLPTFGK